MATPMAQEDTTTEAENSIAWHFAIAVPSTLVLPAVWCRRVSATPIYMQQCGGIANV